MNASRYALNVLVVGLGSMGKRRVRDLSACGASVQGFDLREDRRRETALQFGIPTVESFEHGLAAKPDVTFICTPPDRHLEFAIPAAKNGSHVFIELNIIDEDLSLLERVAEEEGVVVAPSATMRFHTSIRLIKSLLSSGALGKPLTYSHVFGQWLPLWHPWEDYRSFFAARRATGACREIAPLELNWLCALFGPLTTVCGYRRKLSSLDADIDDCYHALLEHETGAVGHLQVDVISKVRHRATRIVAEDGVVEWRMGEGVRVYTAADGRWEDYPEDSSSYEQMYRDELSAFLDTIQARAQWPHDLRTDAQLVRAVRQLEQSSDRGKALRVHEGTAAWL